MADHFENVKLSDYFDIKDKNIQKILRNGGISNYFREDSVKSIFAIYLMGKKDMHLFDITEPGEAEAETNGIHTEKHGLDQMSADEK